MVLILRDSVIIICLCTHEIWSFNMTDKCYSEEEKSEHNYILSLISKKERKYFYTFGFRFLQKLMNLACLLSIQSNCFLCISSCHNLGTSFSSLSMISLSASFSWGVPSSLCGNCTIVLLILLTHAMKVQVVMVHQ